MQVDISVVLNIHREKELLAKTLRSIRDAADFAAAAGTTIELVMVLDNACETTAHIAHDFRPQSFSVRVVEVTNSSLAHSRNDGIAAAKGEYICITDGDDLFSYNRLLESLLLARKLGAHYIILPEYLISFGSRQGLSVLTGSGALSPLIFPADHPYISSIFGHHTAFEKHKYVHPRGDRGHAFEDWHMNAELIADGYRYAVARNVALYYRNHAASIMAKARQSAFPLTLEPTRFLEPETFVRVCRDDVEAYEVGTKRPMDRIDDNVHLRDRLLQNPVAMDYLAAAGRIEKLISPDVLFGDHPHSARYASPEAGVAYYKLCELVTGRRYTDVFVVPFFVHGGAEKYTIQAIRSLLRIDPSRRILAIAMEYADEHVTSADLPADVCFVDAYRLAGHLLPHQFVEMTLKLIENAAPGALVHFRAGSGSHRLLRLALQRLEPTNICYYHFFNHKAAKVDLDEPMQLVDEIVKRGGHIITDCTASTRSAQGIVDPRISFVPASCVAEDRVVDASTRKKVLWASRIDKQKRCELLPRIAALISAQDPEVSIEVYGSYNESTHHLLPRKTDRGLEYCGPFERFSDLAQLGHEIFLYTSWYDGMPNVVLEAMAHGKTVVAPDIGGIDDAVVNGTTGILLPSDKNDGRMAKAYADAVLALLSDPTRSESLGRNAQAYINEIRTPERMDAALRDLFGIDTATATVAKARP